MRGERKAFTSGQKQARWLRILLFAYISGAFLFVPGMLVLALAPGALPEARTLSFSFIASVLALVSLLLLALYEIIAILLMFWIHRVYANLEAMEAASAPHSPSWAVASFLLPVANAVMPFFILRQAWDATGLPAARQHNDHAQLPACLVGWWLSWLVIFVGGPVLVALAGLNPTDIGIVLLIVAFVSISCVQGGFLIRVATRLSEAQQRRHERDAGGETRRLPAGMAG